jgi:hypothetical protein
MKKFRNKISKDDWVGLRGLYLLLATDASAINSPEVKRISSFYEGRYGYGAVVGAMAQLTTDNAIRETFTAPDVNWARELDRSIVIKASDPDFPEPIEEVKL